MRLIFISKKGQEFKVWSWIVKSSQKCYKLKFQN